jgi:hypothetical protein
MTEPLGRVWVAEVGGEDGRLAPRLAGARGGPPPPGGGPRGGGGGVPPPGGGGVGWWGLGSVPGGGGGYARPGPGAAGVGSVGPVTSVLTAVTAQACLMPERTTTPRVTRCCC